MLIGSGWPHLSTALQNVLRAARELEIGILLPELVLWEAEAAWFETTRDGVEQFPKRMTTF